ncbi:MAG: carboxypeptidase-like regulatory domain-containing protein [Vicinamibacterales bacterium]
MKRWSLAALAFVLAFAAAPAFAQGGGASSTGTIQGRISDAQGAVLPGVTVTASSPSMLGEQTTVSSETGNYRFPAVPPGTYTVTYELAGFNTLRREGVQITLGFTANLNVELTLATLQETVTVTGASPIIDTTSTRVQQNFKLEQLQSIPNGRDMGAAGRDAGRPDDAHRRGRQPRGHADRLQRLWLLGPGAGAHRGHQHHRGHRRRRLLLRLRLARRSVPRHVGPGRGDAEPGRAEPVHRQVGGQPVLG